MVSILFSRFQNTFVSFKTHLLNPLSFTLDIFMPMMIASLPKKGSLSAFAKKTHFIIITEKSDKQLS